MAVAPSAMQSILILDHDSDLSSRLQNELCTAFDLIDVAENMQTAQQLLQRCHYDLMIADLNLIEQMGSDWIRVLHDQNHMTSVIVTAAAESMQAPIEFIRAGAVDYLTKPFDNNQIWMAVERWKQVAGLSRPAPARKSGKNADLTQVGLVGEGAYYDQLSSMIERVASMPFTVLIEGESGTGKELVAHAIHQFSHRQGRFVPINCGGMTAELLESELFGHVKGAFTGAHHAHEGLFNYANGGTLFLDEIGEMPMTMQTHLLRVLEERTIRPVGGNREIPVDVRVVAATHQNLLSCVEAGSFREDLYYRLNALTITIPALRDRKQDVPLLVQHFYDYFANELNLDIPDLDADEMQRLLGHGWPGNVRELRNVIERSMCLGLLPSQSLTSVPLGSRAKAADDLGAVDDSLEAIEKKHILKILDQHHGNKSAAARVLGVSRKTLERKTRGQ